GLLSVPGQSTACAHIKIPKITQEVSPPSRRRLRFHVDLLILRLQIDIFIAKLRRQPSFATTRRIVHRGAGRRAGRREITMSSASGFALLSSRALSAKVVYAGR